MLYRIKIDNFKQFLEELAKLKVSNNVKEYFLRNNNEVKNKYKNLFDDKRTKNNYINPGIKKDLIVTKKEVENSFKETAKDKAVSWYLIFNRYIKFNAIPKEITTFRFLCLNKKANEPGDINNINIKID